MLLDEKKMIFEQILQQTECSQPTGNISQVGLSQEDTDADETEKMSDENDDENDYGIINKKIRLFWLISFNSIFFELVPVYLLDILKVML